MDMSIDIVRLGNLAYIMVKLVYSMYTPLGDSRESKKYELSLENDPPNSTPANEDK